ncbi:MAG: tyrosine-protein phosphatase [Clostridia bacterium]|nr:tyrosine-protein phosphatase [Clostridia bacterium]
MAFFLYIIYKDFYVTLTPEQIEEKRHTTAEFKQDYATSLYNAFKLFTDESNSPILFHCTHGADRTGTFAFLLSGMLGVGIDDLYRDFELTVFAQGVDVGVRTSNTMNRKIITKIT